MVNEGLAALGKIDILVLNVAIRPHHTILETSDEEWHQVMAVNLHACFYLCKAAIPQMMERRHGSIIALGGQDNVTGRTGTAAVSASKMGLQGLIRTLAVELAEYGIRANMVMPGSYPEWYPETEQFTVSSTEYQPGIPMDREGTPREVANACLFLASDESSYVTGDRILVMGGRYVG